MTKQQIKIFDTTLRDGQQCPGAGLTPDQNYQYARLAAKVGIDVLEAGFPAASQLDFEIVQNIGAELSEDPDSPMIAALCQLREPQIIRTIEALQVCKNNKARLHVYLPVDPVLMEASLGKHAADRAKLINDVEQLIKLATDAGQEVEFSAEGYSRMGSNFDFVTDVFRAAVRGGATVINCPDTIGGACRLQGDDYFVAKMQQHADIINQEFAGKHISWSAHCHNDFGLALDNSMNAVFFGPATQVEGCFNGIGERAGNVALEQCIMYIKHFGNSALSDQEYFTRARTEHIQELSDFISEFMLSRQAHFPITGDNAARHTSGGHTNAILKNPLAYQPFDPAEVGKKISFIFGPLSGGNHAKAIIEEQGYLCSEDEKQAIAQHIKDLYSERRKGITDAELMQAYFEYKAPIQAEQYNYKRIGDEITLKIIGKFFDNAESVRITNKGEDSSLAALKTEINKHMADLKIEAYKSEALGSGVSAESQSKITISYQQQEFVGVATDQDIELSALKALVAAVNSAYIACHCKQGV